jgi:hypothetical protein
MKNSREYNIPNNHAENLDRVAATLAAFEKDIDTSRFAINGIWVWPLIRCSIIGKIVYPKQPKTPSHSGYAIYLNAIRKVTNGICSRFKKIRISELTKPQSLEVREADIIALAHVLRRKKYDGKFIEPIIDPVLDLFEAEGYSTFAWNVGPGKSCSPLYRPTLQLHNELQKRVKYATTSEINNATLNNHKWFDLVNEFSRDAFNIRFDWSDFACQFEQIARMQHLFQKCFAASQPRLLLTTCWYTWQETAAILAAKSQNIPVCEIQHGMQEHCHPCFHKWIAVPSTDLLNPYPTWHWVWGRKSKHLLENENSLVRVVLDGGNAFLNKSLRQTKEVKKLNQSGIIIGYTVTWPLEPLIHNLRQTIASCHRSWNWVFRTHPMDLTGKKALEDVRNTLPGYLIDIDSGSESPLIAFLRSVDVHATHESTCALEALCLGMPTVITLPRGLTYFSEWLQQGVFVDGTSPREFSHAVERALRIDADHCRHSAKQLFSNEEDEKRSLSQLIAMVR